MKNVEERCGEQTKSADNESKMTAKSSDRVKRMRGWLGVKSDSSIRGFYDGGDSVSYGDGHSGWNR